MFQELKEIVIKEVNYDDDVTSHQIENTNKQIEMIKRNETEILELKSITGMKNSLEWLKSILELSEQLVDQQRLYYPKNTEKPNEGK